MQQCRICFEEGVGLLTPCRCRGTAAYIHPACLDQYIQYYPDRVCRVCHARFPPFRTTQETAFLFGLFSVIVFLLFASSVRFLVKIALFSAATVLTAYFFHQNLLTTTTMTFLSILFLLFFPTSHFYAVYLWMLLLGATAFVYTVVLYVPMSYLLSIVVAMFVFAYMALLTVAAHAHLDSFAFSVYIGVLYLAWYGWVHGHPRLRLE